MGVRLAFACDGCFVTAEGTDRLRKRFTSFSGRDHGVGTYAVDGVESVVPEGWVVFDPYTQCTYCPSCWSLIEDGASTSDEPPSTDQPGAGAAGGPVADKSAQGDDAGRPVAGDSGTAVAESENRS